MKNKLNFLNLFIFISNINSTNNQYKNHTLYEKNIKNTLIKKIQEQESEILRIVANYNKYNKIMNDMNKENINLEIEILKLQGNIDNHFYKNNINLQLNPIQTEFKEINLKKLSYTQLNNRGKELQKELNKLKSLCKIYDQTYINLSAAIKDNEFTIIQLETMK